MSEKKDPQKNEQGAELQKDEQAANQQKTQPPVDPKASDPEAGLKKTDPPAEPKAPGRTRIMIPSNTGPSGSDDVFVSVNGRDFLIKRDIEVEVPEEVLSVLKNAVITDYVTDGDGRITRERLVPRFPFQVM